MFYKLLSSVLYSIGYFLIIDPTVSKSITKSYNYVYNITKYFRKSPIGYNDL
jgi:hypothetical protein